MKFWKDRWCEKEPICVSFPSLYVSSEMHGKNEGRKDTRILILLDKNPYFARH